MKNSEYMDDDLQIVSGVDKLSLENKLDLFARLSPRGRQEFIQNLSYPGELIRRISEKEMYFTIKSIGIDDATYLLSLTTSKQLIYILDLELWKKDTPDSEAANCWLEKLVDLGEDKLFQFLQTSDPELVISLINLLVKVKVVKSDLDFTEQINSLPSFTLDSIYFIEFLDYSHKDAIERLLTGIFRWSDHYYFNLMQYLTSSDLVEIQNLALRWRSGRLADHGFPDFEESQEIYRYLSPKAISMEVQENSRESNGEITVGTFIDYPLKIALKRNFFERCWNLIPSRSIQDRISLELSHVANKIMIADVKEPGNLEHLIDSLKKASGYINIALENISKLDIGKGSLILTANHMELLFRVGYSLILDLRTQADDFVRLYEGGPENLGYPLSVLLKGLFAKRPFFVETFISEEKIRNFETSEDLYFIRKLLDRNLVQDLWESI
ncbi:MAG: DUF6178 family protein [Desulfomonilaceae bacterium]|jgi:hypothetical protein